MNRSVSKLIGAAVLAFVLVLSVSVLLRGVSGHAGPAHDTSLAAECMSEVEPASEAGASMASAWWGVCAYTCEPCWHSEDCPLLGGYPQQCQGICY